MRRPVRISGLLMFPINIQDACATRELNFNGITVSEPHVHASCMAAFGAVFAHVKDVDEILENMAATI